MLEVRPVKTFVDNYVWMIIDTQQRFAVAIDPGQAQPVMDFLETEQLQLSDIWITHRHPDHIGGLEQFIAWREQAHPRLASLVIKGPKYTPQATYDQLIGAGTTLTNTWLNRSFEVLHIPGHTEDHLGFHSTAATGPNWLFVGDTLFSGGCGRLLGGTPEQLYQSLQSLSRFSADTLIFCAHEYTINNLKFAQHVEPNNSQLTQLQQKISMLRQSGQPSIPSTIARERTINPFLRCDQPQVVASASQYAQRNVGPGLATFVALRQWKDSF